MTAYAICDMGDEVDMQENRLYKRFTVEEMDVQTARISSTKVEIHDISPMGASIIGSKKLNIGREYTLKFGNEDPSFSAKGIVKWEMLIGSRKISEKEVAPLYAAGLEFKGILTAKAAPIIEYISRHMDTRDRRLRGIRFKVLAADLAVLSSLEFYAVRVISLGGMLIETKQEFLTETTFPMELLLPDDERPLFFTGRIAHCNAVPRGDALRYNVGIEFAEMKENDKARLGDFTSVIQCR
jgi:Tfp pilus assembly protein PilZ